MIRKGYEIKFHEVMIYDFDPTATPNNHTLLTLMLDPGVASYWIELRGKNRALYNEEKNKILEEVIEQLERQFGEFRNNIVFTNVATPATYKRYTRNWKGGIQGFNITPKGFKKIIPRTIKRIKRFYLAGQWFEFSGGIPIVLRGGCHVAQLIAHDFKRQNN